MLILTPLRPWLMSGLLFDSSRIDNSFLVWVFYVCIQCIDCLIRASLRFLRDAFCFWLPATPQLAKRDRNPQFFGVKYWVNGYSVSFCWFNLADQPVYPFRCFVFIGFWSNHKTDCQKAVVSDVEKLFCYHLLDWLLPPQLLNGSMRVLTYTLNERMGLLGVCQLVILVSI